MQLPATVTLVVYALAAMRVTGLLAQDQLTGGARGWVVRRVDRHEAEDRGWRAALIYFIHCPWCVSIYVGAGAAVVWYTLGNTPLLLVIAVALAFSQLTGMFSDVGRG